MQCFESNFSFLHGHVIAHDHCASLALFVSFPAYNLQRDVSLSGKWKVCFPEVGQ